MADNTGERPVSDQGRGIMTLVETRNHVRKENQSRVVAIVHPGVDSAFIAWRSDFIKDCRGFALKRKIKRAKDSAESPNTVGGPHKDGFVEEIVASWVGFADGPNVTPGTQQPTTQWPIQKYLWSDFMVNPGDRVAYCVVPMTRKRIETGGRSRIGLERYRRDWR